MYFMSPKDFLPPSTKAFTKHVEAFVLNGETVLPLLPCISAEAHDIGMEIAQMTGNWNPVEIYTAHNMQAERKTFLDAHDSGEEYVPQFEYRHAEEMDLRHAKPVLESLMRRSHLLREDTLQERLTKLSLLYKIQDDLATCDIVTGIKNRNDELTSRGFQAKYPGLDEPLLRFTQEAFERGLRGYREPAVPSILSEDEKNYLETLKIGPEGQAKAFTWALKKYGILREGKEGRGFQVVVDPKGTSIDVRDKSALGPTVFIPTDRAEAVTGKELCALIAHEISAHARQAVNGEELFRVGGGALRMDDETMYEGLALRYEHDFREKYFGKKNEDMEHYYFYVFAVEKAEEGWSFQEVFEDQMERRLRYTLMLPYDKPLPPRDAIDPALWKLSQQRAWRTTYRVLRGHVDVRNQHNFAMAKDLSYLRGWLIDQELCKRGLGHLNEAAIVSLGGLQTLAEIGVQEHHLPIPFMDLAPEYAKILLSERA